LHIEQCFVLLFEIIDLQDSHQILLIMLML
jgi:hypothetical protein